MKKIIIGAVLLIFCILLSGFVYTQLLTQEDIEFQEFDNAQGAALGSISKIDWPWESYNQWQCFSIKKLNYDCADYVNGALVPSLRVETQQEIFLFDVHVEDRLDCEHTLAQWRTLIGGGQEVCIFAAHMPDVDIDAENGKPQSLWYINRLKGVDGYWNLFEESSEFRDQN